MPSELKYEKQKVSQKHLSALMIFILCNTDGKTERGDIVEGFYGLDRRYCGYYTDPCLRGKQKSCYELRYRRAQSAISKALRRLNERGLICLIRRGRYVKEVCLTEDGFILSRYLTRCKQQSKSVKKTTSKRY